MLTQKYEKQFLGEYDKKNNIGKVIRSIIETEKKVNKKLLKWDEEQIFLFLKEFKLISPIALRKDLSVLRKFVEFICKKELIH